MHILGLLYGVAFVIIKFLEIVALIVSIPYYFTKSKKCPPIEDEILLYTATNLAEKIRNREIRVEKVVQAYISRIVAVNPIINAVVEYCFTEALEKARNIDKLLANTELTTEELRVKYPLLGVPITIKSAVAVKGYDHGSGRVFPIKKTASRDARVVQLVSEAGAVILLLSNTPELCMALESYNNVTGTTNNPYDTRRTPGGSSGGEAALLAAGASLIGIGSDLSGSIRVPAHYCGIWGHKPTPFVVSLDGHYPDSREKIIWTSLLTIGPMTRYASDLLLLYKVIAEKPLQLHEKVSLSELKFYYMENDGGSILTHPVDHDIVYAIKKVRTHLERRYGANVQQLKLDDFSFAETVQLKILALNEIDTLFDKNSNSPIFELWQFIRGKSRATLIPILQGILNGLVMRLPSSVQQWVDYKLTQTKEKLISILGTDGVLLYPSHPKAAHVHGQMLGRYFDYHYTAIFNGLGFPATQCPVGLNSKGLPIGIQIVAAPNNDRLTLAVASEIETTFGGWVPP